MFHTGLCAAIVVVGLVSSAIASEGIADVEICMNFSLSNTDRIKEFSARGWESRELDLGPDSFLQALDFLSVTSKNVQGSEAILKWATARATKYPAQGVLLEKGVLSVLISQTSENRLTCTVISPEPQIDELAAALKIKQPDSGNGNRSFRRKTEEVNISAYEFPESLRPGLELIRGTIFVAYVLKRNPAPPR